MIKGEYTLILGAYHQNIGGVVFYEQRRKSRTLVRTDPGIPIQRADMQGLVHRASDTGLDNDILDP